MVGDRVVSAIVTVRIGDRYAGGGGGYSSADALRSARDDANDLPGIDATAAHGSRGRYHLVDRHLDELVTAEEFRNLLETRDRPHVYIGYAPTDVMHIGHFTTFRKLVDFLEADLTFTVLIADLHAHLDNGKSPFDLLEDRSRYYRSAILLSTYASQRSRKPIDSVVHPDVSGRGQK